MSQSITLLAVLHEFQGPKFHNYVDDPDYKILVEDFISRVDFVFEEAGGKSPSIAEEFADSILKPDHYMDVDLQIARGPRSASENELRTVARLTCGIRRNHAAS